MYAEFRVFYIEAHRINQLSPDIILPYDLESVELDTTDVYKLNITKVTALKHKIRKTKYSFYVADDLKNITQWNDMVQNKHNTYHPIVAPRVTNKPVAIDKIVNDIHIDPALMIHKNIHWHMLKPDKDIVINRNLRQIYPLRTNDFPAIIKQLFRETRR